MKQFQRLAQFAEENQINIGENEQKQFADFCSLLIRENKVMNLTAIDEPEEIEVRHFIDCLEGATVIKELWQIMSGTGTKTDKYDFSLIDIGSGAGFPGIPLKIVFPEAKFTLLDSLNKRIVFLDKVIKELELQNVTAISARAEDLGKEGSVSRETFDFVTSRAVASLPVLLEYSLPFVKVGGFGVFYKSGDYAEELENAKVAIDVLGGNLEKVYEFELPEVQMKVKGQNAKEKGEATDNTEKIRRSLIIIRKINATPVKYPRRSGKPLKSPIR